MNASALRPHRGNLILVLGVLGIICTCMPLGIVAWVLGHQELKDIDAGVVDPAGRGSAAAGRILGMVGVALWLLAALGGLAVVTLGILSGTNCCFGC